MNELASTDSQFQALVEKQKQTCARYRFAFWLGVAVMVLALPLGVINRPLGILAAIGGAAWIVISGLAGALTFPQVVCPDCKKPAWSPWQSCWKTFCCSCGSEDHAVRLLMGDTICNACGAQRAASKFPMLPPRPRRFCTRCKTALPRNEAVE
jgi:hypothetical protein